ncbi:MAG TPA: LuxR C-terminal-related transcriptional regulator [Chloroflexota bacterium]|nr:LuxR C-terminal-related transcriptional regulator [Chloroflexota bacterium]
MAFDVVVHPSALADRDSDDLVERLSPALPSDKEMVTVQLTPSTVLLVGTNHIANLGLHALLVEQPGLNLLDDVQQPGVAVRIASRYRPDQIIVDAAVGGMGLVPFTRTLRNTSPTSRIVVVGTKDTLHRDTLRRLADLGVRGYLLWYRLSRDMVVLCLAVVLVDDLVVGHRAMLDELLMTSERPRTLRSDELALADNERTVLTLLAEGLCQKEIAREISASEATVRRTVASLRHKFGVASTYALCAQAGRRGFVL